MENPFFFDIYRSVEIAAHARGYEVVVANTDYRPEQLVNSIRLMMGRRVAGLAVIIAEMEPAIIETLSESPMPVVFYDGGAPKPNITSIRGNYRKGVDKIIDYLHSLGHRRLCFIGHHSRLNPVKERLQAVKAAAARHTPTMEVRAAYDTDTLDGGRNAMRMILDSGYRPTAAVCVNDVTAVGVLRELRERGLRVPQDISVTGFDNIKLAEFCYPALTTVHIPRDRIGQIICSRLLPGDDPVEPTDREIVIDPELVVRDTTGPRPR